MKALLTLVLLCVSLISHAAQPEPLPPEQAYRLAASLLDARTIEVRFQIAPGYYLYQNKLGFALAGSPAKLGPIELPPGLAHEDRFFGKQPIYREGLVLTLTLDQPAGEGAVLTVSHQGCADFGICYPPSEVPLELHPATMSEVGKPAASATLLALDAPAAPALAEAPQAAAAPAAAPEEERISGLLDGGKLPLILASFFGFGLLLSFTPCTLPMLPILSGIIVGHGHKISHTRAFSLCSAYVLGMAVTYAAAGVAAAFSGQLLSAWLQNVWVLGAFALLFLLLATALYLVSPVLPPILPMLGWAALLLAGGIFLRALDSLPPDAKPLQRLFKALGLLALLAGAAIFIGALAGSRNPLQPLSGLSGCSTAAACENTAPRFERISSSAELDARIAASSQPLMLDFYADWCVTCKEMEAQTFADPQIAARLAGFTLLQVDVTANTVEHRALLKRFGLFGPPGILFFAPRSEEIAGTRVVGFMGPEGFGRILQKVKELP